MPTATQAPDDLDQFVQSYLKSSASKPTAGASDEEDLDSFVKSYQSQAATPRSTNAAIPTTPPGPSIEAAAPPSLFQRAKSTIANSAIGHAVSEQLPKVANALGIEPTETVYNPEEQEHAGEIVAPGAAFTKSGGTKGVAEFAGGLTTPGNVMLAAGSGGLGELSSVLGETAKTVVPKLISLGFSAQMAGQAVQRLPDLKKAITEKRYDDATQIATESGLSLLFSALGVKHAGTEMPADLVATLDRSKAVAPEPPVNGETASDYLKSVTDKSAATVARTDRINAPVNVPPTPETTAAPPILSRQTPRAPIDNLSAQAQDVAARAQDAAAQQAPPLQVTDRRAVRPEDIPAYQSRHFIGASNATAAVVPSSDAIEQMLSAPTEHTAPGALPRTVPGLGTSAPGLGTSAPVVGAGEKLAPETPETLQAQTDALAAGTNPVVYFPKGTGILPALPDNATETNVSGDMPGAGTYYHDDSVTPQQIRSAVKDGTYGELLGHVQSKEEAEAPENVPAAITARDASGNELKASVVDAAEPALVREQANTLAKQFPGATIDAEPTEKVIATRQGVPRQFNSRTREELATKESTPADQAQALRTDNIRMQEAIRQGMGTPEERTDATNRIQQNEEMIRSLESKAITTQDTAAMARTVHPDLHGLAENVRHLDPDKAALLGFAADGNISVSEKTTQERIARIQERIPDVRQAIEFGRAAEELAAAERDASETSASEKEISANTGSTSHGSSPERQVEEGGARAEEAANVTPEQLTPENDLDTHVLAHRVTSIEARTKNGQRISLSEITSLNDLMDGIEARNAQRISEAAARAERIRESDASRQSSQSGTLLTTQREEPGRTAENAETKESGAANVETENGNTEGSKPTARPGATAGEPSVAAEPHATNTPAGAESSRIDNVKPEVGSRISVTSGPLEGRDVEVAKVGETGVYVDAGRGPVRFVKYGDFEEAYAPARRMEPIEGTGDTKTRGLALGVEEKAVREKLARDFGDLPKYNTVSMKDQAAKAVALVSDDPETARDIAMGRERPPTGLLPESVFVAVEDKALRDGDVNTLRDLATQSSLVSEATTMGQRIRALGERDDASPTEAIRNLQESRVKEAQVKLPKGETVDSAKGRIAREIKVAITKATPKKEDWASFVQSIQC